MSTPKEIAKRIKAKGSQRPERDRVRAVSDQQVVRLVAGLNKLRFYCQVCEKSCRDDNGYKCHLASEAHQRQILVFASNR